MDSTTVQRLALAWMRRKRWEHKALAAEVVGLLGRAMGSKEGEGKTASPPVKKGFWISGGEMLAMMGVKL